MNAEEMFISPQILLMKITIISIHTPFFEKDESKSKDFTCNNSPF